MNNSFKYQAPYSEEQLQEAVLTNLSDRFDIEKEEYGDYTFEYLGALATLAVETIPNSCICIFIAHELGENIVHLPKILELCNIVNSKLEMCVATIFNNFIMIKATVFVPDLKYVDESVNIALSKLKEGAQYLYTLLDNFTIAGCPKNYDFMADYIKESYTTGLASLTKE